MIRTCEMHTAGEPVRIVESGYPPVLGKSILDKRRYASEELDHLRRRLMLEPRGHADMYGALLVEPDIDADLAVLFMHNEGYSTMCGHAVIALAKYAVARGLVAVTEPTTTLVIQCPCGPVDAWVDVHEGRPGRSGFTSVPAFAAAAPEQHDGLGYHIAYGGAFYAIAPAQQFGLTVRHDRVTDLVAAATTVTKAARSSPSVRHPLEPELGYLYGSILTDGREGQPGAPSSNICVFADGQVDRSPTGSGVTARIALERRLGRIEPGETRAYESVIGTSMSATLVEDTTVGDVPAVTVAVAGEAFFTGSAEFTVEPGDALADGFRLR